MPLLKCRAGSIVDLLLQAARKFYCVTVIQRMGVVASSLVLLCARCCPAHDLGARCRFAVSLRLCNPPRKAPLEEGSCSLQGLLWQLDALPHHLLFYVHNLKENGQGGCGANLPIAANASDMLNIVVGVALKW